MEAEAIQEEVKSRLKSPFYGSWAIAFCILNWKAIFILLYPNGDLGLFDRIDYIEGTLYDEGWKHWILLVIGPLAAALVAVVGMPWVLNFFEAIRYRSTVWRDNRNTEWDDRRRPADLTIKDLKKKISDLERTVASRAEILAATTTEVANLQRGNAVLAGLAKDRMVDYIDGHPGLRMTVWQIEHNVDPLTWVGSDISPMHLGLAELNKERKPVLTSLGREVLERVAKKA
ncbi:MAG: hypothetical protein JST66_12085 [Bacteroidetes bacterium]|nr:hypothetical protein [Bacteroidota bacterium]